VQRPVPLTIAYIVAWCDQHKQCRGKLPRQYSGPVVDGPLGLNWRKTDNALRLGLRGLEGGASLAKLLGAAINAAFEAGARVSRPVRHWRRSYTSKRVNGVNSSHRTRRG
jgi:hypothetical protein